jgi:hypothetical protein
MTTTTDNLKNLCRWVRRNYPKIAHLTNEDLAIFPLQEWWERDHNRKKAKSKTSTPPPAQEPVVEPPPASPTISKRKKKKEVVAAEPKVVPVIDPITGATVGYVSPQQAPNGSYDRMVFSRPSKAHGSRRQRRYSYGSDKQPLTPQDFWKGRSGPIGCASNPWQGGRCSRR